MEKFISKDYLYDFYYKRETTKFFSVLNESEQVRQRNSYSYEITVFLSHKHDETEVLKQVIFLLKTMGVSVYVDWLDEGMPKTTSGITAKRIKEKISKSKKFIFLATEGAINSKWCNWELGFGDAKKYPTNIAILPITDKREANWSGSEYLQIYPVITTDEIHFVGDYYVEFEGEKAKLIDWFKKQ
jgi:hypothetical protein